MGNTSFNPADASAAISLSNGNLTATATNSNNNAVRTLGGPQYSGKYYFEIRADAIANNYAAFGIAGPGALLSTLWNTNAALAAIRFRAGSIYYNGVSGPFTGQMIVSGNVCGVAVDLDNGKIWFRHPDGNGWNGDGSAGEDPATNSGGGDISGFCRLGVWPCTLFAATGNVLTANFGDSVFAHWCQVALPPAGRRMTMRSISTRQRSPARWSIARQPVPSRFRPAAMNATFCFSSFPKRPMERRPLFPSATPPGSPGSAANNISSTPATRAISRFGGRMRRQD
jgi:hypothetical protein